MNDPTRDDLIRLRFDEGLTREKIAERYNVSIATVRRWIKEYDVPRPRRDSSSSRGSKNKVSEAIASPDDGFTSLEKAQVVLGPRLLERPGYGYYLDGRPAHIDQILAAADLS